MILTVDLVDEKATRSLGAVVAALIAPGDVVLLSGGLGAGKTTLTKGLVEALGGDEVTSPTFTLCQFYETKPEIAHVDCWRLESTAELADLALEEVLDAGGVAVIEWGERAASILGSEALHVTLREARGPRRGVPSTSRSIGRIALLETIGQEWSRRGRHLEAACRNAGLMPDVIAPDSVGAMADIDDAASWDAR
jgi:tRNA threonylcarbamoyladenosine biosynthesis protein TsaE